MSYSIADVKSDLDGILHGTSTNKVTNITSLFNRAARQVLEDIDPQETKRDEELSSPIFDSVYDYTPPEDLKGNKIIDIRPQVNRNVNDNFSQRYSEEFDLYKSRENNWFQVAYDEGSKVLRLKKRLKTAITVNNVDGISTNGTWAVGGDAGNLSEDNVNFVTSGASLKFDLSGAGTTGYLENATMNEIDLSEHENQSSLFIYLYFPDSSIITNVDLRWGSSSAAYWNATVTSGQAGAFVDGWNLIKFDWNGASETGSPDSSAIDYARVTITYDGTADTDLRFDLVKSDLGQIFNILYYSKYIFRDGTTGVWKEQTDATSDLVNLDTESYNLFLYKTAEFCSQQTERSKDDTIYFKQEYERAKRRYQSLYKSEVEKPSANYYRMPNKTGRVLNIKP